ncbi:hypothetical protein BRC91_12485 [Halobacteriales archaeon QS_4_62_28]|nr:MAG: hypothetical protein BRC91_12485 [Halobacteriales archaeon QS_4_62_28]
MSPMSGMHNTIQRCVSLSRVVVRRLRRLPNGAATVLRAAAFWLAIVLPAVYFPLLFVEGPATTVAVSGLLVVHIVSVLVGSTHDPRR